MNRIIVFGNSGSGKSTLAKKLVNQYQCQHLDLDTIAWQPVSPPKRQPIEVSQQRINELVADKESWIIEGYYAELLEIAAPLATQAVFLNLPIAQCIENAKNRPFEPHKYESKAAQDANLDMLIQWIGEYENRDDTFSKQAHQALYDQFSGDKRTVLNNE